jgi:hypothetical protein
MDSLAGVAIKPDALEKYALKEEAMKVTRIETLRCDAGWRVFSFLEVSRADGPACAAASPGNSP